MVFDRSGNTVVYLDTGLVDFIGHHSAVCRTLLAAFRRRGIAPRVLLSRKASADVVREFRAIPQLGYFTGRWYLYRNYLDPDDGPWEKAVEDLIDGAIKQLLADFDTLDRFLRPSLIFMGTAHGPIVQAIARWLASRDPADRPVVVLDMGMPTSAEYTGEYLTSDVVIPTGEDNCLAAIYHTAAKELAAHTDLPLVITAPSAGTARLVEAFLRHPVAASCMSQGVGTSRRRRQMGDRLIAGVLGHQKREDKGFAHIIELLPHLRALRPQVHILIHDCEDGDEALTPEFRQWAASDPGIELVVGCQDTEGFARLLDLVDLLICPYRPAHYQTVVSGLMADAIANGLVTVIPAGTSMHALLRSTGGGGEVFAEWTPPSILAAVLRAVDRFDELAALAHKAAWAWEETHGPDRFIDHILASAERLGWRPGGRR